MIKARTDEDVQMTYVVNEALYQGTFGQTYVIVKQEISNTTNYNRLAPAWQGTVDGDIVWTIVDNPTTIKYDWNVYNDISYKPVINR